VASSLTASAKPWLIWLQYIVESKRRLVWSRYLML